MADGTHIEWTDATWNIVNGCSVLSPGCTNCYAMKLAGTRLKHVDSRKGLTIDTKAGPVWNGTTKFNNPVLLDPIKWKRPRKIFVCAHGDLFHESVPDEWIDRVFAVMALAPQHVFQVLTKRSARMRRYVTALVDGQRGILTAMSDLGAPDTEANAVALFGDASPDKRRPLPNVWLGVSVEDQQRADERIPDLLATPAAVRWLSCEPLLGPVDLSEVCNGHYFQNPLTGHRWHDAPEGEFSATDMLGAKIGWVVGGGESGPRPMHPDWIRKLRDQCAASGVPFLFKQWGSYSLAYDRDRDDPDWRRCSEVANRPGQWLNLAGGQGFHGDRVHYAARVGKKAAGRLLDGVEHNGYPS